MIILFEFVFPISQEEFLQKNQIIGLNKGDEIKIY